MAVTAVQQASALLAGKSPIPGYIAPNWDEQTPLADWLVAAGVVGHYLGDVSTGIRQPIDLTAPSAAGSYTLRVHGKGVKVGAVLKDLARRSPAEPEAGVVEVHAFKLGKHTMLLARRDVTGQHMVNPIVYRNGSAPAPLWSLIPTEKGAVPQSSTTSQLLSAMHALYSPGCDRSWVWSSKHTTNQSYTLRTLAGLELVNAHGAASTLTPAGHGLMSAGADMAELRMAEILDTHALTLAVRSGGRQAVEQLLSSLSKGDAMDTRPTHDGLTRKLSDIAQWATWAQGTLEAAGAPSAAQPTRSVVVAMPGLSLEESAAAALLAELRRMDPVHFENLVARVAEAQGLTDITTTARSGDGGVDVAAKAYGAFGCVQDVIIQAKRFKANVGTPVIREMRGTGPTCAQRIVVTTSDFTPHAYDEAAQADRKINLLNGRGLALLCVQHEVGVRRDATGYELTDLSEFAA